MPFITSDDNNHYLGWFQFDSTSYPVMNYPKMDNSIMNASLQLIEHALTNYQKVILVRLDFHMNKFTNHNKAIQNLFNKLKVQIKEQFSSNLFYLWVRERTCTSLPQHYHVVLALSGHTCLNSWNVYHIARDIWEAHPDSGSCYHPYNPFYTLSRISNRKFHENLKACIYRVSYLAKDKSKENNPEVKRRYGTGGFSRNAGGCTYSLESYFEHEHILPLSSQCTAMLFGQ